MGGGDLNLKKSWHPSTFQNLEKVWKAEQHHDQERKKIEQLQQEIREERAREEMHKAAVDSGLIKQREDRVEWLYSGAAGASVNREEYLLGKKIDRFVDPMLVEEEREKEALSSGAGALFMSADSVNTSADLAVKIREDPLFVIRQREEAAKKRIASNPMKLRKLKQMAEGERKEHTKRKHKKKRKRYSPEDASPSGSPPHRKHSPPPSPPHRKHLSPPHRKHPSPPHTKPKYQSRTRERSTGSGQRASPPPRQKRPYSSRYQPYSRPTSHTRGMDKDELERRRQEMMDSAREHGREREKRLRKHEADVTTEEHTAKHEHKSDFLQPLRVQSLSSSGSLGDRIHRNIHSVQRTSAKLESNFMSK